VQAHKHVPIELLITAFGLIADPRARYVSDFSFPTEEEHEKPRVPFWELIISDEKIKPDSEQHNPPVWVMKDNTNLDKCRTYHIDDSSGHVRLIFISYKTVADPLEKLKEVLTGDLNLPELVKSLKLIKLGRQRLVFELPSAIDALFALENYCKLFYTTPHISYEILSVEE
ncbi:hypothetical protein KR018_010646, partial [Drosophila ironensis]